MREIVVVLQDIRSIHNVGSIFRTADGAGVRKIILCGITPTPLDRFKKYREDFSKVALGAEKTLAWEVNVSTVRAIKKLKKEGYVVVAAEQAGNSVPYHTYKPNAEKIALVMGNEVEGLPKPMLALADAVIEIPMRGKKESLNVSVAFGIAVYRLRYP